MRKQVGTIPVMEWAVGLGLFATVIVMLAVTSWIESRPGFLERTLEVLDDESGEVEIGGDESESPSE